MTASLGVALPAGADGLAPEFAARVLPSFETALAGTVSGLGEHVAWLEQAARHAVGAQGVGGRRWRPLLAMASAIAAGGHSEDAVDVALAVELTHTASLVLDDLPCMDDTALRRGVPATHRVVGSAGAILVAVGLLGRAAELLGRVPLVGAELASQWGRTIGLEGMCGGQAVDVARAGAARAAARRLHREKTTALSAFALRAGARAAGAPADTAALLAQFGRDLGWAYQLADDADDVVEDARQGAAAGGCAPRHQSAWLLRRAERRLRAAPGLTADGVALILALAHSVVPMEHRPFGHG